MREKVKLTANILFSGIGCQERGFENSGLFDLDVLNTSDINKESVLSYAAIHCGMTNEMVDEYKGYPSREEMAQYLTDINLGYEPEKDRYFDWFKLAKRKNNEINKYWLACKLTHNKGDISKIEELPYADFWTCSFPCTDISVAGKMKGLNLDSGTRSSLLWKNIKLLDKAKDNKTLPKYIMVENVKNLVSQKFIEQFNDLINVFDELGFNTYWKVINGKECGVPQNRERVFVICIRKDIDTGLFDFPVPFDNGIRLRDILEDKVDEKYYLSNHKAQELILNLQSTEENELKQIGYMNNYNGDANRIYSDNLARTLKSNAGGGGAKTGWYYIKKRIRKLTPRECYKLMGLTFSDCDRAYSLGIVDSHLYKQAGNGIITDCVELIAEHLYKAQYDNTYECIDVNFTQPQVI